MGWKTTVFIVLLVAILATLNSWNWLEEYLDEMEREEKEAEARKDEEATSAPPTQTTEQPPQHPASFFFLCERLGKDKHIDSEFDNIYKFYNDDSACYISGRANEYRGNRNKGSSGRKCEKWGIIVDYLQTQINLFQTEKQKLSNDEKWTKLTKTNSNIDTFIEMTNKTITEMRNKGILHHNYCRDPDDTGVPWCYIKVNDEVAWEPCDVPKCTTCWGIRQNAETSYGRMNNYWSPYCHMTEGTFLPLQIFIPRLLNKEHSCHEDYCWCSEKNGTIVNGTAQHKETQGMPVCDPVLRAQLANLEPGVTTDGYDANQVFVDTLMKTQLDSYRTLIEIASSIFDDKKSPADKKSQENQKLS